MMKGLRKVLLAKYFLGLIVSCLMSGCIPENIELPINKNGNGEVMGEVNGEDPGILENPELPEGAVDLGLPSGLLWASCNVGANSPEEYGDYFAWGETETKSSFSLSNSATYGLSISVLKSRGIIDGDGNLAAAYDAATANWGGNWRMPTLAEINELVNNCTWEWTTQNGVKGSKVTGPNDNSIFLPAAGTIYDGGTGSVGYYWSAAPEVGSSSFACWFSFYHSDFYWGSGGNRSDGLTVRPVTEY